MLGSDRSWTVRGRSYPTTAPPPLEKNEQLVNVRIDSPATTPEAARSKRDGRAESMTCTSILIQKNAQGAQLERDRSLWSMQSVWSVSCGSNNKTNSTSEQPIDRIDQTDQIDETDRIDQEAHR
jgi:hypothetical protein